jgi:hypothetical protein
VISYPSHSSTSTPPSLHGEFASSRKSPSIPSMVFGPGSARLSPFPMLLPFLLHLLELLLRHVLSRLPVVVKMGGEPIPQRAPKPRDGWCHVIRGQAASRPKWNRAVDRTVSFVELLAG